MQNRYYDLNTYFRQRFGERVHKIAVDAGLTCPNRDGTLGSSGCIYCNERGSGTGAHARGLSITEQIEASKIPIAKRFKAKKFLVYFQSFSNTYAPVEQLEALYKEALSVPDVVGLTIGTRPDCVDEATLTVLERLAGKHLIWIEYGLQSAHDPTLALIRRGHDVATFDRAVYATAGRGINICAHIIFGLPGETAGHMRATADHIAQLPIDGVKLHLLYIVKGTPMETLYQSGQYRCMEQDEYADLACDLIERLSEKVVIQRLTGDPHRKELVAPQWALKKDHTLNLIKQELFQRGSRQGTKYREPINKV